MPHNILSYLFPLPDAFVESPSTGLCVVGGEHSCLTSLLFQAAINVASEVHDGLVYVISPTHLDDIPPLVHHMKRVGPEVAKRIVFHYTHSPEELLKFLANLHTQNILPSAIAVEQLNIFMRNAKDTADSIGRTLITTKILALLQDLAAFCTRKSGRECRVFLSSLNIDKQTEQYPEIKTISSIAELFYDVYHVEPVADLTYKQCFEMSNHDAVITYYLDGDEVFLKSATVRVAETN